MMNEVSVSFLHRLVMYVQSLFSSLASIIFTFLGIACFVFFVFLLITLFRMKKKAAPKVDIKPPKPGGAAANIIQEDPELRLKLPPIGGWLSAFLSKKGIFRVSSLSMSFLHALDYLRESVGEGDYRYRLPWFLLVGTEGSGKTSLIQQSERLFPPDQPLFTHSSLRPSCSWWFLRSAVVLDIRGDLFLKADSSPIDGRIWRSLLVLLSRYRAAKPINGVILTIPVTELYGRDKFSLDRIHERAQEVFYQLTTAQQSLGLKIPIYIMVTKCDNIPGFKQFCSAIPIQNRSNILGWSNPYTLNITYTKQWVDEGFAELHGQLQQLRLEILAEYHQSPLRDGNFVFPKELLELKEPLGVYIDTIFKADRYQESFIFRGFYFCGDGGGANIGDLPLFSQIDLSKPNVQDVVLKPFSSDLVKQEPKLNINLLQLFFVDDLFTEKIFREGGVASAMSTRLITANRGINIAKVSTVLFVIVGTYGVFHSYDQFARNRNVILPVLEKMISVLHGMQKIHIDDDNISTDVFENCSHQMISMMESLETTNFFSIFVPASWFSPLQENLYKTLQIIYKQVVIRTIYVDLLLKARSILHTAPLPEKHLTSKLSQLLNPLTTPEYGILKKYMDDLIMLEKYIQTFNDLKYSADPKDLADLVFYTFQTRLSERFWSHHKKFRAFLRNVSLPLIDLAPYQLLARQTLNTLFQHFLNILSDTQTMHGLPYQLDSFINTLSHKEDTYEKSIEYVKTFTHELVEAKLQDVSQNWMDYDVFNPGPEFQLLFRKLEHFSLFGKEVSQFLTDQTAVAFQNLKRHLVSLNQGLGILPQIAKEQKVKKELPPSSGLVFLEKKLALFFLEPFMSLPLTEEQLISNVPQGKRISWDSALVQQAYDIAQRYEDFVKKNLVQFPPVLHENLRDLAQKSLQLRVLNLLGRAQTFIDMPIKFSKNSEREDVVRSSVNDIKDAYPKFIKLLEILNIGDFGFSCSEFKSILSQHVFWILGQIDKILNHTSPYVFHDSTFQFWKGDPGAAVEGYGLRDGIELKNYVDIQYTFIRTITLDFARPLLDFLSHPTMASLNENTPLLLKWRQILESIQDEQKHLPKNRVKQLHDWIMEDMNLMDMNEILSKVSIAEIQHTQGGFFSEVLCQIKRGVRSRAEVLRRKKSLELYKKITAFFNQHIRGRFPFASPHNTFQPKELLPMTLIEFYEMFKACGGDTKVILDQIYQLGSDAAPMVQFISRLSDCLDFFSHYFDTSSGNELPLFEFDVDFRMNREWEVGGDMILNWVLSPNLDVQITNHDKKKTGRWFYGSPFEVRFSWPVSEEVTIRPVVDPKQSALAVDGSTAIFRYPHHWSLLWLLKMHSAQKDEYSSVKNPHTRVLKFSIPTNQGKATHVYIGVTMIKPSADPKIPGEPISFPTFPIHAPDIPSEIQKYAEEPVLSSGSISPATWESFNAVF